MKQHRKVLGALVVLAAIVTCTSVSIAESTPSADLKYICIDGGGSLIMELDSHVGRVLRKKVEINFFAPDPAPGGLCRTQRSYLSKNLTSIQADTQLALCHTDMQVMDGTIFLDLYLLSPSNEGKILNVQPGYRRYPFSEAEGCLYMAEKLTGIAPLTP